MLMLCVTYPLIIGVSNQGYFYTILEYGIDCDTECIRFKHSLYFYLFVSYGYNSIDGIIDIC